MTMNQLQAMIDAAVAKALAGQVSPQAQPKAKTAKPKAKPVNGAGLDQKDAAIVAGFKRQGITDVTLLDRGNPEKPYNVRTYGGWLDQGRQVRKGSRGVRALFHFSQTDAIKAAKTKTKAAKH